MKEEVKQTQVWESMGYLLDRIEQMSSLLTDLEQRLEQVRTLKPKDSPDEKKDKLYRCKLAMTIFDYGDKVDSIAQRINDILKTLEI